MVTLTAPGADILPWSGGKVNPLDAWHWNADMWTRWPQLREAASTDARRRSKGQRSGLLVVVPEEQKRGVLHLHLVLGAETVLERRWAESFGRYCRQNATKYGFGRQVHVGKRWAPTRSLTGYVSKLAKYVSKGSGLRVMWETGELPARAVYVSRRLTATSGLTIRMLRRRGAAWARWRLAVSTAAVAQWRAWERSLGRELTRGELACLEGVRPRRT